MVITQRFLIFLISLQAAKETGALQAAKTMLEKQVEELTCQLQLEKRMRVITRITSASYLSLVCIPLFG